MDTVSRPGLGVIYGRRLAVEGKASGCAAALCRGKRKEAVEAEARVSPKTRGTNRDAKNESDTLGLAPKPPTNNKRLHPLPLRSPCRLVHCERAHPGSLQGSTMMKL